jgi:hypothetical protein
VRFSRVYLLAIILSVLATAAVVAAAIFWMSFAGEELFASALIVLAYFVVGFGCAVALENGKRPRLMISGMIVGIVGLGCWMVYLWVDPFQWEYDVARLAVWPTVWACLMALIGLLLLPDRPLRWWRLMRLATIFLLLVFGVHVALAVTFYPDRSGARLNDLSRWDVRLYEDVAFRFGGTLISLACASLAMTLIGLWIAKMRPIPPSIVERDSADGRERVAYWLRCPRCGCEHEAKTGVHHCVRCGLRARVELT